MIEEREPWDYSHLIGMKTKAGPPISFQRCRCGLLVMAAPCSVCTEMLSRSMPGMQTMVPASGTASGFPLVVVMSLVLFVFGVIALSMDGSPSRDISQTVELD